MFKQVYLNYLKKYFNRIIRSKYLSDFYSAQTVLCGSGLQIYTSGFDHLQQFSPSH